MAASRDPSRTTMLTTLALLPLALPLTPTASPVADGYKLPPTEVVELLDAAPAPSMRLSPDRRWAVLVEGKAMPSLAEVARPMLRLAGMRIDPAASERYRTGYDVGLVLRDLGTGEDRRISLGDRSGVGSVWWSPDSRRFAFSTPTDPADTDTTELWVVDVATPGAKRRVARSLNLVLGAVAWMPGGDRLMVTEVPAERGVAPERPRVPAGPNTQETAGSTSPLRTFQDLLQDGHDADLFEFHATSELVVIDLEARMEGSDELATRRWRVGPAAMYSGFDLAPDGRHLLVTTLERPFSFLQTYWSFPTRTEVWDLEGEADPYVVLEKPLDAGIPIGGVREGRRSIRWHPHAPATLLWVEAQDGGDPKTEAGHRDRWFQLAAPFDGEPAARWLVEHRARGLSFTEDPAHVIVSEYDRDRRWSRATLYDELRDVAPVVIEDRSRNDRYGDPGRLVTRLRADGRSLVRLDGGLAYRTGTGASPDGDLPFLDRVHLATGETERLWRCEPGAYETVVALAAAAGPDGAAPAVYTRHETSTTAPSYRLRGGGEVRQLTEPMAPPAWLADVHKELVTYERADGVPLSATLYLPPGHQDGDRHPLFVWAYPREYNDPSTAGQVSGSPSRYTRIRGSSHLALLTQGYAILDGATMPVVGDAETMNDTFVPQIVAAAEAAIDFAVERGIADRDRVAVGGHSYGAFMTANLLAHSDLFATGIARSGAYNRSLTPFGFQSERRTFWEAPDAYFGVSPFMHADDIDEPVLMIHGEIDNNSGTFPIQSERLYQAIQGHGGTARLVMLPHESHGYRARESVLHVQAEMIEWLDRWLKVEERPD